MRSAGLRLNDFPQITLILFADLRKFLAAYSDSAICVIDLRLRELAYCIPADRALS